MRFEDMSLPELKSNLIYWKENGESNIRSSDIIICLEEIIAKKESTEWNKLPVVQPDADDLAYLAKKEPKQVIVIRKDLNMRKGKCCAQVAHASMAAILSKTTHGDYDGERIIHAGDSDSPLRQWLEGRFTKVVVSCDSEQEIMELLKKAVDAGMINSLITDCGLTEFHNVPTVTCLAIGPDWSEEIDKITGHLKLM